MTPKGEVTEEMRERMMLERMNSGQFRFSDLWMQFADGTGDSNPAYRQADRLIQRERKAGRIRMVKHAIWEVVPEARQEQS